LGDRLRLAFVADFELFSGERRNKPAVTIRNGDKDPDDVAGPSEHRLLTPSRADYAKTTRNECRTRDEPRHGHDFLADRAAPALKSYHELNR
jgi:hypothetical protein